jgi:hypothetical protein
MKKIILIVGALLLVACSDDTGNSANVASKPCPNDSWSCIEKYWTNKENLEMLKSLDERINKDLPTTIDPITIWESTSINTNKRMITYYYKINTAFLEQDYDYQEIREIMKTANEMRFTDMCKFSNSPLKLIPDIKLRMIYRNQNIEIFNNEIFKSEDCGKQFTDL